MAIAKSCTSLKTGTGFTTYKSLMQKTRFLALNFFVGTAISITGAYLKIIHAANAQPWLVVGFIMGVVFLAIALPEIMQSRRISSTEKLMWVTGLLFVSTIAGFMYLTRGRQRIINTKE